MISRDFMGNVSCVCIMDGNSALYTRGAFFWEYTGYSHSGLGITEYTEYQFAKYTFSKRNTISEGDLGTIVSAHAPIPLAWRAEKVPRKFGTRNVEIWL